MHRTHVIVSATKPKYRENTSHKEINSYSAHTYNVTEQECSIQSMLQLIQLDTLCYVAEEISITLQTCRIDALLSTVSLIKYYMIEIFPFRCEQ